MSILEKEGCAAKDLKETNKIKRFNLRHQIEKHYQIKDYSEEKKNKEYLDNKYSYKRYNVPENRGYDIVNKETINKSQKENTKLKHNVTEWDTLCKNSKGNLKEHYNFTTYNEGLNKTNFSHKPSKGNISFFI